MVFKAYRWPDRVNFNDGAPLREARAELIIIGQAIAQTVETFGDLFAVGSDEIFRARIDFDAGNHIVLAHKLRKENAGRGLLPNRLVVHNHAADVLRNFRRRKQ